MTDQGMAELKVGSKLFHKHWSRDRYTEHLITGETKGTWVLDGGATVNKRTMMTRAGRYGADRYYTEEQRDARMFCDKHARDIAAAVSVCEEPDKLRQIAALIGKELKP